VKGGCRGSGREDRGGGGPRCSSAQAGEGKGLLAGGRESVEWGPAVVTSWCSVRLKRKTSERGAMKWKKCVLSFLGVSVM
jgi:hypothetical protein